MPVVCGIFCFFIHSSSGHIRIRQFCGGVAALPLLFYRAVIVFVSYSPGAFTSKNSQRRRRRLKEEKLLYNEGECVLLCPVGRLSGEGAIFFFFLPAARHAVRLSFVAPFVNAKRRKKQPAGGRLLLP